MTSTAILIDCDPGLDDAIALLLALASADRLELLGISVVAGNVPLQLCADNARKICELAGRGELGVYAGCARPLLQPLTTAPEIHGATGLGGVRLPAPSTPLRPGHAVDFLIDAALGREGLTLCALGPLTNLAMALIKAPEIAPRIREIVLMGGAMRQGNVTPAAEFNIYVDPHAASVVFDSGIPVTMFGLDVTHQVLATESRVAALAALPGPAARTAAELIASLPARQAERYGGHPLHDPCVIAYLLAPELFVGRDCRVEVVTDSGIALGQTVVDWWGGKEGRRPANANVVVEADDGGFFELLNERLARL